MFFNNPCGSSSFWLESKVMNRAEFVRWVNALTFGKRLPTAVYIHRPQDWRIISPELAATVERAMNAARPDPGWNLLKLHTDQVAITFLTYPEFDSVPHPALAEATKINLNTGAVVRMEYSKRANPPFFTGKKLSYRLMILDPLASLN